MSARLVEFALAVRDLHPVAYHALSFLLICLFLLLIGSGVAP